MLFAFYDKNGRGGESISKKIGHHHVLFSFRTRTLTILFSAHRMEPQRLKDKYQSEEWRYAMVPRLARLAVHVLTVFCLG
jgi:hypothetical protein